MISKKTLLLLALSGLVSSPAVAGMFGDAPDAVLCAFPETGDRPAFTGVYYADAQTDDGTVYYKTLGKLPLQITVSSDGVVTAEKVPTCNQKTVKELRDSGAAFDFR